MLIGADEEQISQYFGHWATGHPNVENGKCVQAVVKVKKFHSSSLIGNDKIIYTNSNFIAQTNMSIFLEFLLPVSKALPTVKYVDQCKQIQVEKI